MKTTPLIACAIATLLISCASNNNGNGKGNNVDKSKKEVHHFLIERALSSVKAQEVLDPIISTQFAGGSGRVLRSNLISKKQSTSFGKSIEAACQQAFLSAVNQFQKIAKKSGGTGVINLVSNYKKITYSSKTQYQCAVGTIMAGVELKGDIIL